MKILDLTHLIEEAMPVYPETEPPKLTPSNTFEQHGFRETLLTMGSHTGTHMDAPAHMLRDGKTLDQFPADKYIGTAYVLDCSDLAGKEIPKARLQLHASEIEAADFLLFYTGWEKYWGSEQYFSPFPVLSLEAAEYLAAFPLKGDDLFFTHGKASGANRRLCRIPSLYNIRKPLCPRQNGFSFNPPAWRRRAQASRQRS